MSNFTVKIIVTLLMLVGLIVGSSDAVDYL